MQQPHFGYTVQPHIVKAAGTSSLHGIAVVHAAQHNWHCPLTIANSLFTQLIPQQPNGNKHVPPGLQQHSKFKQHTPAWTYS